VGIAGLGTIGTAVARALLAGAVPGLELCAVAVRNAASAAERLGTVIPVLDCTGLAGACDIVVESLPRALFRSVAEPAIAKGRTFVPLSVGALLDEGDLIETARTTGARILVPTGALLGLDAVKAAAEGHISSVNMVTRKPPAGLAGAPYLIEHGIGIEGLTEPLLVFSGSARDGARGFPANVNVAAALSLAGIGPDRTQMEIWADPGVTRNTHRIVVEADSARLTMMIENVPTGENPKTGKITALSTLTALRGLVATLRVGS
jgi:aspartate dehydrogenase